MATLTMRAEQALLGAMLADPGLIAAVRQYLEPGNFTSGTNLKVFTACLQAHERGGPFSPDSWRETAEALAGDAGVPRWYPETLAEVCPEISHGRAYGALVMQAAARRELAATAADFTRAGGAMQGNARRLAQADGTGGRRLGELARHATVVADAMCVHALVFDPDITQIPAGPPAAPRGRSREEELVLAALLHEPPESGQILALPLDAVLTSQHRTAMLAAIRHLDVNARDIDALTVDWETALQASRELPQPRDGTPPASTAPTYAERLAEIRTDDGTDILATATALAGKPGDRCRPAAPHAEPNRLHLVQQPPPASPQHDHGGPVQGR